jgi:hypothetical protein
MDATTFLILMLILYIGERRSSQSLALVRLSLDLLRERRRADDAVARLAVVRADVLRARAHMRQGLSPLVVRYGIDDPDLDAMSGILYQISEGDDHGRSGR